MNYNDKAVLELRQLLSSGNTEERVAIYHGLAIPVVSKIIEMTCDGRLKSKPEANLFVKELVLNLNEISIVNTPLLQKIILNRLGYLVDDMTTNEVIENVIGIEKFEDTFNFGKYFGGEEVELINKNIALLKRTVISTFKALNSILPERE